MTDAETAARLEALENGLQDLYDLVGAQQFIIEMLLVRYLHDIRPEERESFGAMVIDAWSKAIKPPGSEAEREAVTRTRKRLEGVVRAALRKLAN